MTTAATSNGDPFKGWQDRSGNGNCTERGRELVLAAALMEVLTDKK